MNPFAHYFAKPAVLAALLVGSASATASLTPGAVQVASERNEASRRPCELSVNARFQEGAPRDYFYITNASEPKWSISEFNLDLEPSAGRLIFDTHAGGKGVDVFQLFEVAEGSAEIGSATLPGDGESQLRIHFLRFDAGDTFSFSIDVDDQLRDSSLGQIRVAGSEIAGSVLQVQLINEQGEERTQQLRFNADNTTQIEVSGCQA
ncbi:MAG: hypothetical protein AB8B63_18655 [Granulosicoccus sp.]